jgi:thiopurine S-methyltransferase
LDQRFWEQRWAEGSTAFHRGAVSPALERHARTYFPPGSRILVPLCGKSLDLAWLAAQGFDVQGVEFVEQAAREFFAEHEIEPEHVGDTWRAPRLAIQCGDFLEVDLGASFGGIWDRAAMIAIPPADRPAYTRRIRGFLDQGAVLLLEGFDYDSATFSGPPYPLAPRDVRASFSGLRIEELGQEDVLRTEPKWRERGAVSATSTTWAIRA